MTDTGIMITQTVSLTVETPRARLRAGDVLLCTVDTRTRVGGFDSDVRGCTVARVSCDTVEYSGRNAMIPAGHNVVVSRQLPGPDAAAPALIFELPTQDEDWGYQYWQTITTDDGDVSGRGFICQDADGGEYRYEYHGLREDGWQIQVSVEGVAATASMARRMIVRGASELWAADVLPIPVDYTTREYRSA